MSEDTKQQKHEAMQYDTVLAPVDNPDSDCYGCEAGMCDHQICRGDQYFYELDNRDYDPPEQLKEEPKPKQMVKKTILRCIMCDWEHNDPNNWLWFERVENGSLQKKCGGCGRPMLKDIEIEVPDNGC
jgi:hypothetical protein